MKSMYSRYVLLLLAFCAGVHSAPADQTGAELRKKPVKVEIVAKDAEHEGFGTVRVTYEDGTSDFWTKKGNCRLARVAPDGTVVWVVDNSLELPELPRAFSSILILSRKGRIISRISSGYPVIESWNFLPSGRQLALEAGFYHGPRSFFERYDTVTGECLESISVAVKNPPAWSKALTE